LKQQAGQNSEWPFMVPAGWQAFAGLGVHTLTQWQICGTISLKTRIHGSRNLWEEREVTHLTTILYGVQAMFCVCSWDFGLSGVEVLIPKRRLLPEMDTTVGPSNWKLRCHLATLGSSCQWTKRQRRMLLYSQKYLVLITKRKLSYFYTLRAMRSLSWIQVIFVGWLLILPCVVVKVHGKQCIVEQCRLFRNADLSYPTGQEIVTSQVLV
jgi:hypothetical protein